MLHLYHLDRRHPWMDSELYIQLHDLVKDTKPITYKYNTRIAFYLFREFYLTSAGWVAEGNRQVSTVYMMRSQNYSVVSTCFADHNWECLEVTRENL